MPTHIRITDELHDWLKEEARVNEAFEDVVRRHSDDLGPRQDPVKAPGDD